MNTTPICGYCGRPVIGFGAYNGGRAYHPECTHGPDYGKYIYQMPPLYVKRIENAVLGGYIKVMRLFGE